jgi:hypothetical protein
MEYEPLRPRWYHWLRTGLSRPRGVDARKVVDRTGEVPLWVERGYEHQSNERLTWRLIIEAKSQGVWSRELLLAELLDTDNVGGFWLRRQDDRVATFDEMWAKAVQHAPLWSEEQATALVLEAIEATPGIQLVRLRKIVGGKRGHLDDLLKGLVASGELREERTYGPSGTQCTSRRFWREGKRPVAQVAKGVATAVSLSLLAMSTSTALALTATTAAKGHRTSAAHSSVSFVQALTDKKMWERGKRLYLWMAAKTRERKRTQAGLPRPTRQPEPHRLSLAELQTLAIGLDL